MAVFDRVFAILLRNALESSIGVTEKACLVAPGKQQNPGEPSVKYRDASYRLIYALRQEDLLSCDEARNKAINDWLAEIGEIARPL